jgi:hypothetical protein
MSKGHYTLDTLAQVLELLGYDGEDNITEVVLKPDRVKVVRFMPETGSYRTDAYPIGRVVILSAE